MLRARKLGPLCELGLQPPLMENPEVPARGVLLATAELAVGLAASRGAVGYHGDVEAFEQAR